MARTLTYASFDPTHPLQRCAVCGQSFRVGAGSGQLVSETGQPTDAVCTACMQTGQQAIYTALMDRAHTLYAMAASVLKDAQATEQTARKTVRSL